MFRVKKLDTNEAQYNGLRKVLSSPFQHRHTILVLVLVDSIIYLLHL